MKIKTQILFLLVLCHLQFCKAQKSSSNSYAVKIENQLKGELDYSKGGLEYILIQENDENIRGKINKDGMVHFNLPEFNIKAVFDSIPLQHYNFQSLFLMQSCEGKDLFDKTPFDDVYSQKYDPIYIEKYGIRVGVLYPVSDEKMLSNNKYVSDSLAVGSKFHWFYIDRAIDYEEKCLKTSFSGWYDIEVNISADIQLKKGWNLIKENLVEIQNVSRDDYHTTKPKKIHFSSSSPESKEVKWFIKQIAKDEEIQVAKKLYSLTPITKEQFEKWAPNKLGDLSVTTKEYGNPPKGRKNKNNIHLTYANETQKREIDLYVVDYSKNPGASEMIDFAYAMENDGKDEKDIKRYITQFNERENVTQLWYKVGDRMFVEASGADVSAEELWDYIKKLNVEKLLKK